MSTGILSVQRERFQLYYECQEEHPGEPAPVYLTSDVEFESRKTEMGSEVTAAIPAPVPRALDLPLGDGGDV
jgi:hypothetical protein